jgi:c-di-GMP-binding flagellar brake protein YcgR
VNKYSHPVHLLDVRKDENELIDNSISSDGPTDQFQSRVVGIIEDEVIKIEVTQSRSTNTPRQLSLSD